MRTINDVVNAMNDSSGRDRDVEAIPRPDWPATNIEGGAHHEEGSARRGGSIGR
jgi:hypothetical protein